MFQNLIIISTTMKPLIVCLCVAGATVLLAFTIKMVQMKIKYSRQALQMTDSELDKKITTLWIETGEKFSFKKSIMLGVLEKESERRNRKR